MTHPHATVRLQLHGGFTLDDALRQVPYFSAMGVSHFYLSPVTQAVPGSTHGYDVVNAGLVNPELGGEQALQRLAHTLRDHGMGILLDIVPNHMATHFTNPWWWDVLKHGPESQYANWFDINWKPDDASLRGKVLAPFLGAEYAQSLQEGVLRLAYDEASADYFIDAGGARFPLAEGSLAHTGQSVESVLHMHHASSPEGCTRLDHLLQRQHYRLCNWRHAATDINWRRFFEISGLIGVRVEDADVFDAVHALPLRLYAEGVIDGLRIDHVDGLAQPLAYCDRLRNAMQQCRPDGVAGDAQPWIVVEKILAPGEILDERWRVNGTTGYDFMDQVGAVLHEAQGASRLAQQWRSLIHSEQSADDYVRDARALMVQRHFVAETRALSGALRNAISAGGYPMAQCPAHTFECALASLLVSFPLYRSYLDDIEVNARDIELIKTSAAQAAQTWPQSSVEQDCLGLIAAVLTEPASTLANSVSARQPREWVRRFQQLTPPLAAKSLEDTVFYRYGPLLSRNEVGSDPAVLASTVGEFHAFNTLRRERFNLALSATATHDHKRGEDARARLAVLSQLADRWLGWCQEWGRWTPSMSMPTSAVWRAERYMLWQTLLAAWPMDLQPDNAKGLADFGVRVCQWQRKALREAKLSSSWFEPNTDYELLCAQYVHELLGWSQAAAAHLAHNEDANAVDTHEHDTRSGLATRFFVAVSDIVPAAAINSLAQTVLRLTCPGVPDLYQGNEWWDFSLVDPDNRREVDYAARSQTLPPDAAQADLPVLMGSWREGRLKQALIQRLLLMRRQYADIFFGGEYVPVEVSGVAADKFMAFIWQHKADAILVLVPRLCAAHVGCDEDGRLKIDMTNWDETGIMVPALHGRHLHDLLSGRRHHVGQDGQMTVRSLLTDFPCAVLVTV